MPARTTSRPLRVTAECQRDPRRRARRAAAPCTAAPRRSPGHAPSTPTLRAAGRAARLEERPRRRLGDEAERVVARQERVVQPTPLEHAAQRRGRERPAWTERDARRLHGIGTGAHQIRRHARPDPPCLSKALTICEMVSRRAEAAEGRGALDKPPRCIRRCGSVRGHGALRSRPDGLDSSRELSGWRAASGCVPDEGGSCPCWRSFSGGSHCS